MPRTELSQADAAAIVLKDAGKPMHRTEITQEILNRGLQVWSASGPGRTPWETVGRAITQEIVHLGDSSRFDYERKGSGRFRLKQADSVPQAARKTPRLRAGTTIDVELDDKTLAALDVECADRGVARAEMVRRMLRRHLWELDVKRAEEQWERSYREEPSDQTETNLWRAVSASPGPWEPAARQ